MSWLIVERQLSRSWTNNASSAGIGGECNMQSSLISDSASAFAESVKESLRYIV